MECGSNVRNLSSKLGQQYYMDSNSCQWYVLLSTEDSTTDDKNVYFILVIIM